MGMYTSIMHDDKEIQIKTGEDRCDTYRLGDPVDWTVDLSERGRGGLLDGVYEGIYCSDVCQRKSGTPWIVIKDHKVHAITHKGGAELSSEEFFAIKAALTTEHDLKVIPDSLWADHLMAAHAKDVEAKDAEAKANADAFLAKYGPRYGCNSEAMTHLHSDGLNIDLMKVYFDEGVVAFEAEMKDRGFTYEADFEKVLSGGWGRWIPPTKE